MKFIRTLSWLSVILAASIIFSPLIWMKIGPGGYKYYGPTCPDIYIFGGWITGKDLSFAPIEFAKDFQLFIIVIYMGMGIRGIFAGHARRKQRKLNAIRLIMLVLFPVWLQLYSSGVQDNSDCADLRIYFQAGLFLYALLFFVELILGIVLTAEWRRLRHSPSSLPTTPATFQTS